MEQLWIKGEDGLWRPSPKFTITDCAYDTQSITMSFQDGSLIRLTRQALGFSREILDVSVGASKIIIAVELDLSSHPRDYIEAVSGDMGEYGR